MKYLLALLAVIPAALAQSSEWGQCGGIGWTGPTTCVSGTVCTYSNPYYSQCLPGSSTSTSTSTSSKTSSSSTSSSTSSSSKSTTTSSSTTSKSTTTTTTTSTASGPTNAVCGNRALTHFKYKGVSESGAEWGTNTPGVLGTDYTWPSPSSIDYFVGQGFNTFRIPFLMERLTPSGLTGGFNSAYLSGLTTIVNYVTGKGAYALIDPHNYMRFNGVIINSTSDFTTWWVNVANEFKSNQNVFFDLQNEPNGIAANVVFNLMQAAVNGIRAAGASNMIYVEGTSWTGAWTWVSSGNGAAFTGLTDPMNNIAIEMHQYLDSDGSGTNGTCVNSTIGSSRIADATAWLQQYNFKGFLGEFGGGSNSVCATAVQGMLCDMQASGVWIGALWWAAGPWWGTYFMSMEPPSGASIPLILPAIQAAEM